MENKETIPEQPQSQQPPKEVHNPLDEPVQEKSYSQPNINTQGINMNAPIDEPRFTPPPFKKVEPEQPKREPVNPDMKNLPKKDTEMAATQAANMILAGYDWVHQLANKGLLVSEKKLDKLQAEGEINLNAVIDYDYGKKIRAGDFFKEYNEQQEGLLSVTPEFKEEVTPVLVRVLSKRGIGMTDEQTLMYMFGKDIAAKSIIFFQQKTQLNYMIESIKQATMAQAPTPPPRPQQQQPAPPPPASAAPPADVEVYEPEEKYSNELVVKKRGAAAGANKRDSKNNNKK